MKYLLLTVFGLFLVGQAAAQSERVSVSGYVREGERKDIEGAVVEIISGSDTLRAVTTRYGTFIIKNVNMGNAIVRISHLSYKPYERKIVVKKGDDPLKIELELAVQEIEDVTVKTDIPLYKMNGDTLIYNAAAIKTLEGDDAVKILEQLPGIIFDNTGLTAMGKKIARTYVDGKLIFGEDPMTALLNLTAADVQRIKVYDEYSEFDRRHKRMAAQKRRVLDIQTKSKLISATTGHFLASYGTDFARDDEGKFQERYGAGVTANFFSEKFRLSGNTYTNNVNRTSNRLTDLLNIKNASQPYAENTYAGIGYEQMFGDEKWVSPELSADYSFKNAYTRNESYSSREYFPTSDYATRSYYDSLYRVQRTETHFAKVLFNWQGFSFNQNFNTSFDRSEGMQRSLSVLDGAGSIANADSRDRMRTYGYDLSTGWYGTLMERINLSVLGTLSLGKNDGSEVSIDSLSSQPLKEEYRSAPYGRQSRFYVRLRHPFPPSRSHIRQKQFPPDDPAAVASLDSESAGAFPWSLFRSAEIRRFAPLGRLRYKYGCQQLKFPVYHSNRTSVDGTTLHAGRRFQSALSFGRKSRSEADLYTQFEVDYPISLHSQALRGWAYSRSNSQEIPSPIARRSIKRELHCPSIIIMQCLPAGPSPRTKM